MPAQNPTNPFPAWRLPNGIINASDGDLERSIGACERWAWVGGAFVIGGVAAEVAIAAYHPLYDSWIEQWGSALANSLVAIGVALEIIFSRMAGLRQNELRRRSDEKAIEANDRSAQLEKDAATLRASVAEAEARAAEANASAKKSELLLAQVRQQMKPRELAPLALAKELEGKPKAPIDVLYFQDDWETYQLAFMICWGLKAAGWGYVGPLPRKGGRALFGVNVFMRVDSPKDNELLQQSLRDDFIAPPEGPIGALSALAAAFTKIFGGVSVGGDSTLQIGQVRIVVGSKPPS